MARLLTDPLHVAALQSGALEPRRGVIIGGTHRGRLAQRAALRQAVPMQITDTALPGGKLVQPVRHGDARGYFSEVFREDALVKAGIDMRFVQENHSLSASPGVVRG